MRSDGVVERLRAWHAGKPLPLYETLHFPVAPAADALILAFVRMGGESAPWGIAVGHPGERPTLLTVPEARNRDLVAQMVAELAPHLLAHFRHPEYVDEGEVLHDADEPMPLRQLWVPNPTHLDMLHALAYSYTFTKWRGDAERARKLNAVGRLAGWLFREAQRPGQVTVMAATRALQSAFTFPADTIRQAHLGYLLAWLETRGGRDRRLAAADEAERHSISTSLDPAIERDQLDAMVARWNEATRAGDERRARKEAVPIRRLLEGELETRFQLVERARNVLDADRRRTNAGVAALASKSTRELWYQYLRLEHQLDDDTYGPAFVPSPETDRYPAAAASRYFVHEGSEDGRLAALLHDDAALQAEVLASGDGVRGTIVKVLARATEKGRPVWVLRVSDDVPLRIRQDTELCVAGLPKRTVQIRSIERATPSTLLVEVEVIGCLTAPRGPAGAGVLHADAPALRGMEVTLLPTSKEGITQSKIRKLWSRDVVGGWLTHAPPAGVRATLPSDVGEDLEAVQEKVRA